MNRRSVLRRLVVIALFVSCIWNFGKARECEAAAEKNKHRRCDMCHLTAKPVKDLPLFAAGTDPSSLCLRCHEYEKNHHPVGFKPAESSYAAQGDEFPLFDGEMRCLTCHDPHGRPDFTETPKLLRGGPYADRREICFKCHHEEKYTEIDPHIMLDNDGAYRIIDGKLICLMCHAAVPNPAVDRTNDVMFRADVGFLCWRCHPPMPGEFFHHHFLKKPTKKTLSIMRKAEKEFDVILPIVPRGRITCSTCHNPHQKGVMAHEPAKAGADSTYRLRMRATALCGACHQGK